jgi:UDP-galactopyranose mutase
MATKLHVDFSKLTTNDIVSVYSGKPGCCCGCKGKHRYNSKHRAEGTQTRGYPVLNDEVNDAQVTRILRFVQAHAVNAVVQDTCIVVETPTRWYIIYPTKAYLAANTKVEPDLTSVIESSDTEMDVKLTAAFLGLSQQATDNALAALS